MNKIPHPSDDWDLETCREQLRLCTRALDARDALIEELRDENKQLLSKNKEFKKIVPRLILSISQAEHSLSIGHDNDARMTLKAALLGE